MLLLSALIFGLLAACFALFFELTLAALTYTTKLTYILPLIIAPITEELSKFFLIRQYARRYLNGVSLSKKKVLLLGLLFGLGFASVEAFLVIHEESLLSLLPLLGSILLHVVTSIMFAFYWLGFFQHRPRQGLIILSSLIVLHMLYNFLIFWQS